MPENMIYCSHSPEDARYSARLNSVEKCMACWKGENIENLCKPAICFGTGRGKCELCRRFEDVRFDCCQQAQREQGTVAREDIKKLGQRLGTAPGPLAKPMAQAIRPDQYDDEIPF
jgi:hypothetical protein